MAIGKLEKTAAESNPVHTSTIGRCFPGQHDFTQGRFEEGGISTFLYCRKCGHAVRLATIPGMMSEQA